MDKGSLQEPILNYPFFIRCMALTYAAVMVFVLIALLLPFSIALFSRLIRLRMASNSIARLNYESGEESRGTGMTIMSEYLHYFPSFLAFEIIAAVILIWSQVFESFPFTLNMEILALPIFGFILELFVITLAKAKE